MKRILVFALCIWGVALGALAQSEFPVEARPLDEADDLAPLMVARLHKFLDEQTTLALGRREVKWNRDYSSPKAYEKSVEPNRARFKRIIGATHPMPEKVAFEFIASSPDGPEIVAESSLYKVVAVRWPVVEEVMAEGLLVLPHEKPRAFVVAIPDADMTPETLLHLPLANTEIGSVAALAEAGCRVLVPTLLSRDDAFSGNPAIRKMTNQPHREYVYRMSYELGMHVIGHEVQTVMTGISALAGANDARDLPVGVIGYGEGGLLALYSAACDSRIKVTAVSGYFTDRGNLWKEPIYRNVWNLLSEFGDAEIASLVAPRSLLIEASRAPRVEGPPKPRGNRYGAAPGSIEIPWFELVEPEFEKAKTFYESLHQSDRIALFEGVHWPGQPLEKPFLKHFLNELLGKGEPPARISEKVAIKSLPDPTERQRRLVSQWVEFTQRQLRESATRRKAFWEATSPTLGAADVEHYPEAVEPLRRAFAEDVIGAFPAPTMPPAPRMRVLYDTPEFTGYETMLDVWPGVFASGILLWPKDLKPGEKRPVVVCQHGLEGRPKDVIEPGDIYRSFAAELAKRGYITYAPQNPYIGETEFRQLQRKAHPLGKSLFSIIVGQHQQLLNWLTTLPGIDPSRIAFYGLSYGGKTAMRVPAIETRYCLSICSADFNEWVTKCATTDHDFSYMFTPEYDMYEFNLGGTFNYSEMAALICPRPFMVERGHDDGVGRDEWVAFEFAKVYERYDKLGIGDRCEIEWFNGPHRINGVGTYDFLARHLNWPVQ